MRALGLKNVHTEPVRVPRWIRGTAAAEVMAPARQTMHVVALGPSVPTGPDGLTAEVVEVASYEELQGARRRRARQDRAVQPAGDAARPQLRRVRPPVAASAAAARWRRPSRARWRRWCARRARAPIGCRTPAACATRTGRRKIPAAALAVEDAELLHRLLQSGGPVRVRLVLTPAARRRGRVGQRRRRGARARASAARSCCSAPTSTRGTSAPAPSTTPPAAPSSWTRRASSPPSGARPSARCASCSS